MPSPTPLFRGQGHQRCRPAGTALLRQSIFSHLAGYDDLNNAERHSSVSATYGQQQGAASNGHFGCTGYHPLFAFNPFGDLERVLLRRGNRHSAKFWRRVLLPVIARYRDLKVPEFFRGDAAFASPKLFGVLEQEGYWYAIRLKADAVLERQIAHLMKRPVGRYQARSWDRARRG